jgi:hypothetical protein
MNNLTDGTGTPAPPPDLRRALAAIGADHPGWYAWEGVIAGVLYARWLGSSPPRVVRAISPGALARAIEADEWEWANRWVRR